MSWKRTFHAARWAVLGAAAAILFVRGGWLPAPPSSETLRVVSGSTAGEAELRAGYEKKIAALSKEVDALRESAGSAASEAVRAPATPEVLARISAEQMVRAQEIAERRFNDRLVAAGFTPDRIQWIKRRSKELEAMQAREVADAQQSGKALDINKVVAHMFDPDLGLVEEMGVDEYDRYRTALGRPKGVDVASIRRGSNAELSGLKPGDQIVAYAGRRVFNIGQLKSLMGTSARGAGPVLVDVERNGVVLQVTANGGDLGLDSSMQLPIPR